MVLECQQLWLRPITFDYQYPLHSNAFTYSIMHSYTQHVLHCGFATCELRTGTAGELTHGSLLYPGGTFALLALLRTTRSVIA